MYFNIFYVYFKYSDHGILYHSFALVSLIGTADWQLLSPALVCDSATFAEMSWLDMRFGCIYTDVKISETFLPLKGGVNISNEADFTTSGHTAMSKSSDSLKQLLSAVLVATKLTTVVFFLMFQLISSQVRRKPVHPPPCAPLKARAVSRDHYYRP